MLADGLYQFLIESFGDQVVRNGPCFTITAYAEPAVKVNLIEHVYTVRVYRARGYLGLHTKRFLRQYQPPLNGDKADYWYETGGLKFDLSKPDSLDWLVKGIKAILSDNEEELRKHYCQDGSSVVAIMAS